MRILLLLLAFIASVTHAQEAYVRTDLLTHKSYPGNWKFSVSKKDKGMLVQKHVAGAQPEKETVTTWQRITIFPREKLRQVEQVSKPFTWMKSGERGIGFIYTYRAGQKDPIAAWPMFYSVGNFENVYQVDAVVHLDRGEVLYISRMFTEEEEYAPLWEERLILDENKKIISHVRDKRK